MGRRIGPFGLVNYKLHPSNQNYHVFSFNSVEEVDMFSEELAKQNMWFERSEDEVKGGIIYLCGVNKKDYQKAMKVNYLVSAKYRNPIIKNKLLRIMLITLTASLLTLGIIGYVKNMQKLHERTEQLENE